MVGLAGGTVVFERVPDAHSLLAARPHGALLAEQRRRLESGVDDAAAAVCDPHADAAAAVPGLHGHHVRRTAHAGRHHRLTATGFFVSFPAQEKPNVTDKYYYLYGRIVNFLFF